MVTRVSSVYRVDIQKNDHRQTKDGDKQKKQDPFKDVLAKVLVSTKS